MAVANLVLSHLDQIINFARNAVTNAGAEGINSVVMTIQRVARGIAPGEPSEWASCSSAVA
jgi:hypothetical protein